MNINNLARPNILKLIPYSSAREENINGVLMDANENPYNTLGEEYVELEMNRYPDPNQTEIRQKLGGYLEISPENIFCGVGSDEIIDLLIRIFCEPERDEAVIIVPTYGMFEVACSINNVSVNKIYLDERFQIDVENTITKFNGNLKLLYLCSPNNPTGNLLNKRDIIRLVKSFNGIVVLDEAYIDFALEQTLIEEINNYKNLVILRTFSKAWGLAGIRFGYCAASAEIIKLLFKIKAPYNLNKLTANIVLKVLQNDWKKEKIVSIINSERERVSEIMESMSGIENVYKSDANFILFRCNNSEKVLKYLSAKKIIIRNRSSEPLLTNCLRISIGTGIENDIFLKELSEALCG